MNLYERCETDPEIERTGIEIECFGAVWKIAYAGGGNAAYLSAMEKLYRKNRRAIDTKTLPRKVSNRLSLELFVDHILLGWDEGVTDSDGPIAFNRDNAIKVMEDLPVVYKILQDESEDYQKFLKAFDEDDSGNS